MIQASTLSGYFHGFWRVLSSVALAGMLAGCPQKSDDSTLRIQLTAEPVSLDPSLAEDGISMRVLANLMDGLVGYDEQGKLENRLAESHHVSMDQRTYTFTIRSGALWSDGRPVTADDFAVGLLRTLDPATGAKTANQLFAIRGAEGYHFKRKTASAVGIRVANGQLVVELERPTSYFTQVLSLVGAYPQRADYLTAHAGKWDERAPVTGPYLMVEHRLEQSIRLIPNPRYWKRQAIPSAPLPMPVTLQVVGDDTTAVNLFESGLLDILVRVSTPELARFKTRGWARIDPFDATYYLSFNTRVEPFNHREWRRAVSGAIRRTEIVTAMGGAELPARGWVPLGLEGYIPYEDPALHFAESMEKVKSEITAGAPAKIIAGFDSSDRNQLVMEKVQQDLQKSLGLAVELQHLDWKAYIKSMQVKPAQIYRFGWLAPFRDPITHLEAFTSKNPNNYSGWSNRTYDALVAEVAHLPSGPARAAKIVEAQRLLVDEDAAIVPLFHYVQVHAVSNRVLGFNVAPNGVIRFDRLKKR